jgi:hypothetical protein
MSDCDCHSATQIVQRRTMVIVLVINAGVFVLESVAGILTQAVALLADSCAFTRFGDWMCDRWSGVARGDHHSARCASRASQTLRLNLLTCVLARKGEADSRGSLI